MRVACEFTENGAVLMVGGRLTASQAGRLHQSLLGAFERAGRVELALHEVHEADLSFLQILCAAQRTAAARGIAFRVSGLESAEPVLRLIDAAGAAGGVGCPGDCPWPRVSAAAGGPAEPLNRGW